MGTISGEDIRYATTNSEVLVTGSSVVPLIGSDFTVNGQPVLEAIKGRRLRLGDAHPHTRESIKNVIALYEAWKKPEKTEKWRATLAQTEARKE